MKTKRVYEATTAGSAKNKEKEDKDNKHIVHAPQSRSREISVNINDIENIIYADQTGKFPVVLSQDNYYIMILCEKNGNLILVEPMKT